MDGHALYDWEVNTLIGRLLTLVESLGLRETQERAVKDLVRQEVSHLFSCQGVDGEALNTAITKTTEIGRFFPSCAF